MAGKLFGTDGVRGVANVEPITSETALKLGRALAHVLKARPMMSSRSRSDNQGSASLNMVTVSL